MTPDELEFDDELAGIEFEPSTVAPNDDTPQAKRRRKVISKLARSRELDDLRYLMADFRGRRFVRRLLEASRAQETTFTGELAGTSFNEGMRSVGIFVLDEIKEADFDGYIKLLVEANKKEMEDPNA